MGEGEPEPKPEQKKDEPPSAAPPGDVPTEQAPVPDPATPATDLSAPDAESPAENPSTLDASDASDARLAGGTELGVDVPPPAWPEHAQRVVGILLATLVTLMLSLLAVAYVVWVFGCWRLAEWLVRPLRWMVEYPPSWPMVVTLGLAVVLTLFFRPIESFLKRMEKGPFGLQAHLTPRRTERRRNKAAAKKDTK